MLSLPPPRRRTAAREEEQEIVVTGFRASLDAALNVKRKSVSAVDAIVAEDIAKFPDQNLAESLQRIPGISIQRDGGEGRAITVRGLGAQFTRVRVNGLETIATSTDGAASNRDRAFDFNVFASELFSSIVVHKTAEASLDEGSLGAVVDLNTGNPLGGQGRLHLRRFGAGQLQRPVSKNVGPRVAGLLSWKSPDGTFGVVGLGRLSEDRQRSSSATTPCAGRRRASTRSTARLLARAPARPDTNAAAPIARARPATRPRSPSTRASRATARSRHDRERLGLTGSVQWSPTDATKISIDGLYSQLQGDRRREVGRSAAALERALDRRRQLRRSTATTT